jgi:hypothetical protein
MTMRTETQRLLDLGVTPEQFVAMCRADERKLYVLYALISLVIVTGLAMSGFVLATLFAALVGFMITLAVPPLTLAPPTSEIAAYETAWEGRAR